MNLRIDPDFKKLIPPLSHDEFKGLEENILSQRSIRESIKIWRGIIIDGHNRYFISQKNNIPFTTKSLYFANKKEAELWIVENQLGRRNLLNAARIKLVLHKESLLREQVKQNRFSKNNEAINVRKILAKEANVSEQTLGRYMKIRDIGSPVLKQQVDSGKKTINAAYKTLQVTTREVWYDQDLTDISNNITARATLQYVDVIENLCRFLCENRDIVYIHEVEESVERHAIRSSERVREILGWFCD